MKKQFNPFPDVSCRYGAPMGRRGDMLELFKNVKRLHARRQGGGDGYDKGGAYWGSPSNVWGVWFTDTLGVIRCTYVRANSRLDAISKVREGNV